MSDMKQTSDEMNDYNAPMSEMLTSEEIEEYNRESEVE